MKYQRDKDNRTKVEAEHREALKPDKDSSIELAKTIGQLVCRLNPKKAKANLRTYLGSYRPDLHLFIIEQSENL